MKKLIFSVIILLALALSLVAWIEYNNKNEVKKLEAKVDKLASSYPDIYNYINSISYDNLDLFLNTKKDKNILVYVGRPTCGDCTEFEPKLIQQIKENKLQEKMVYLNVAKTRENEEEWNNFKNKYNILYTPTLAIFRNGKVIKQLGWTPSNGVDMNEINLFLKNTSNFDNVN
ncbi:thioredoxin family protein [Listeria innocua]|uniref:thioredoxin family protein n=1 Tax=Listeria innocua TaxID=1642 RepID=UPI00138547CA|nr:thioredoxin family protein [Listeria innocua]ECB9787811.1 thioredoxin family protein [Listeria monocytogenes]EHC2043460.1 thioredoxin family protein [Listeria monocytogenes]MBC1338292.1 thioredoxin family protein [Listeria innocua]MBC1378306.1 thioredoxin family protein [Listeria innocua]MBC1388665.1 thioredoxin family protein [Listeria innocua]